MVRSRKLSPLLFAVGLLLGIAFVHVAHPLKARAVSGATAAVQPVRRELPPESKSQPGQAYGLYPAIVMSRPDAHMRIQVKVPALNISGEWASACVPVGSTGTPSIQSRIWVMFEQGDTHRPVWMGVPGN